MSLESKIESSIFLCLPRDLNILGKSCTTFVIVKIVRNLSRGRSQCQRVNHVKSGVIYFFTFIFSYDTIHVSGTIHTWNRGLPRDLNILGKSCTTFVIVKMVRNLSRGRSPCQRVNHVKSGVIYFFTFIFLYDTIHVSGTIHTWNRGLTPTRESNLPLETRIFCVPTILNSNIRLLDILNNFYYMNFNLFSYKLIKR